MNATTERVAQEEYDSGLKAGRDQMRDGIKHWLLGKAGECFQEEMDERARLLRELAKELPLP